jgi:hypothetical protein
VEQQIAQGIEAFSFQIHEVRSTMVVTRHPLVLHRIAPLVNGIVREQSVALLVVSLLGRQLRDATSNHANRQHSEASDQPTPRGPGWHRDRRPGHKALHPPSGSRPARHTAKVSAHQCAVERSAVGITSACSHGREAAFDRSELSAVQESLAAHVVEAATCHSTDQIANHIASANIAACHRGDSSTGETTAQTAISTEWIDATEGY